jgi:hypothetical protein
MLHLARITVIGCILAPLIAGAQTAAPPTRVVRAARRQLAVKIDGRLTEPAWAMARMTGGFVQSYPRPGAPALEPTEVRVLYDDDALYVGVRMFDSHPDSIAAQLARRDPSGIYSDWVHIGIDSYHDRRTAFVFSVNPLGVKRDAYEFNDNSEDANWDAVWDAATAVDSLGWTAEFRIPLSQLRFASIDAEAERTWGFTVFRDVARRNERDAWSPWNPADNALVSRFGDLTGLVGIRASIHTELVPYVSSKLTRAPVVAGNPFSRANATKPGIGGDFKVALPKGLTLTGAVNPDFGQVEVDPAVVNLSAFETQFPEKRPFFTEGSGIFNFGRTRTYNNYYIEQYFYSRRIGKQPSRTIDAPYVDAPSSTTIATALKLSGKVGPWSIGVIDAVTPREDARFQLGGSAETERAVVEPLSNYFVGRLRRDLSDGHGDVGGMITGTHRSLGDATLAGLLPARATMGGLDFERSWRQGEWYLTGYASGTEVAGTPHAIALTQRSSAHYFQRPDASYLRFDSTRTAIEGGAAELALQHTGAWASSVSLKTVTPGFDVNALGFQARSDYHALSTIIGYQSFTAGRVLRSFSDVAYTNQSWNYGGDIIYNGYATSFNGTFNNFWTANATLTYLPSMMDDRATRGGPMIRVPAVRVANFGVGSDSRRMITAHYALSLENESFGGGHNVVQQLSMSVRPASFLLITAGPTLNSLVASHQFVAQVNDTLATNTFGAHYVMARLSQTTLSAETRVNWTFTPALSLQVYAQPFVAAGHYSSFAEVTRSGSAELRPYADVSSLGDPDFNVRSLRGNAVLRWEYKPGSAVYLVWQQLRSGSVPQGDFELRRDVSAIFREPVTNVLLVKATYWIGL